MNLVTDIYDSARRRHPLVEELIALVKYHNLVYQFVISTIKTRYKRSLLGVVWTLLNPLLTMIVLTLVFSQIFRITVESYPVYVLSGLVAWLFFANTTTMSMQGLVLSGGLLNRIYIPKSIFAVSAAGVGLFNLTISLLPLFAISLIMGTSLHLSLLVLPAAVILLAMFALGVGLILSTAAVYFADMLPVYEVILLLWMYSTPVIYPPDILPQKLLWLFKFNPMFHLIQLFRTPIYEGKIPGLTEWLICAGIALITFILGGLIFTAKSNEYAYRT